MTGEPRERVLFIAARDDLYGASRALLAHARRLPAHGLAPLVVTPGRGPLSEALRASGVDVLEAKAAASARSVKARILASLRLRPLIRSARAQSVRLVVASTLSAAPAARRVASALSVPFVLHLRSTYVDRGMASALRRYGADRADVLVAVSRVVLDEYEHLAGARAVPRRVVVHDGIEVAALRARGDARRALGLPSDGPIAGILGAITSRKATGFAARVAERAGVLLGVLGDGAGPELEAVRATRAARLLGFLPDAAAFLPAFDVLLHPARQEAFGLAPLEAMAAGVPVLASNIEGLKEVATGAAVLLEPACEEVWVEALQKVLSDAALRADLVERGRARSRELSADASAARIAEVYKDAVQGRRS